MNDSSAALMTFFICLALVFCTYIYGGIKIRVAAIESCAKLAGEYNRFKVGNDGCQIGDWKVEP